MVELPTTLPSRRYSIVIANRATGVVRRFTLSRRPVATVGAILLSAPVLLGLGAQWRASTTLAELERTNAALQVENESYRAATGQLASQISALQSAVDELGTRAGADPVAARAMEKLPSAVKTRAMGGANFGAGPIFGSAFGSSDMAFGVLRDMLGVIEHRLDSVRTGVDRRDALAAATPSIWPVTGWLSSAYGTRRDPFTGGSDFHPGLDISAEHGQPVRATADGSINQASPNGAYGNLVEITHGYGISTRYGHLSRFNVRAGQQVKRGDVVGFVGSTGRSTSPHLHYEIWMNGQLTNPLKLLAR